MDTITSVWALYPRETANLRRRRDTLAEALAAEGVDIRGLTFAGLRYIWAVFHSGQPLPPEKRYMP